VAAVCLVGAAAAPHACAQAASNIDTAQPFYLGSGVGTSVNPVFQGGTLRLDQANGSYPQNFTLDGSATNTIDQFGNNSTFSGVFSNAVLGTPGNLIIANSGTGGSVTFTTAGTYTGATTIASGATLYLGGLAATSTASSGFTVNGTLAGSSVSTSLAIQSLSGNGIVSLPYFGATLELTNASGAFAGNITGNGGLGVGGTETLTGINSYAGTTGIGSGDTLKLVGNGSIASSAQIIDDGTLDISGTSAGATIESLAGSYVGSHGTVVLGGQTLTISSSQEYSTQFSGTLVGTGGLAIVGGNVELTGSSTYSGGTTVSNGTLTVNSAAALGAASSSLALNQATLVLQGDFASSGNVALSESNLLNTAGHAASLAGALTGTGELTVTGGGTVTLSGVSTYSGQVAIDSTLFNQNPDGSTTTLALTGSGSLGAATVILRDEPNSYLLTKSVFDISATTAGTSIGSLAGSGTVTLGTQTLAITNGNDTFSGTIGGTGGLTITGGTQTLSGFSTYTGLTTISPGATLALDEGGSIAASSGVVADGTFEFFPSVSGSTLGTTITTLSGSGSVIVSFGVALADAAGTFSGSITASGLATPTPIGASANALDLSGTYAGASPSIGQIGGAFSVLGGTEKVAGSVNVGSTEIDAGASLVVLAGGSLNAAFRLSDNGTLDLSAANTASSVGTLTGTGVIALGGQTLTIANAGHLVLVELPNNTPSTPQNQFSDDGSGAICACFTLATAPPQTIVLTYDVFSGTITGTGGLAVTGGMQALTGINTYSGGTMVSDAVLGVNGDAALGAAPGGLTLANGLLVALAPLNSARSVTLTGIDMIDTNLLGVTLSGPIGGSGSLAVIGGGTLTLTGNNAYAGGTSVTGATLAINADTALGAPSGGLALTGGTLEALANVASARSVALSGSDTVATGGNVVALSGVVSGAGALTVGGGGRLTLSADNTYTGPTTINPGTLLSLVNVGSIASSSGLVDNGTFDISTIRGGSAITTLSGNGVVSLGPATLTLTGASGSFSGTISGSGGLTVAGGTQTLTGINTYDGGTTLSGGTLVVGVAAVGTPGAITSSALGTGRVTLDGGTLQAGGNDIVTNPVAINAAGGTIDAATYTLTMSGTIGGSAGDGIVGGGNAGNLLITSTGGPGTVILNGNSSSFAGATTVVAGTLEVGDAADPGATLGGNVTVNSGATLRGHGTIGGNVTNTGTVYPGASIGILSVGGNYNQSNTGTLSIEITPNAAAGAGVGYDQLRVGGTASLAGALSVIDAAGTYTLGSRYTILTASGGRSGTFATVAYNPIFAAYISPAVTYDANDVYLTVDPTPSPTPSTPPPLFGGGQQVPDALTAMVSAAQGVADAVLDDLCAAPSQRLTTPGQGCVVHQLAGGLHSEVWLRGLGGVGSLTGDGSRSAFNDNYAGTLAGYGIGVGGLTVGLGAGYLATDLNFSDGGNASQNAGVGLLYGRYAHGPMWLGAMAAYGGGQIDGTRVVPGTGLAGTGNRGADFAVIQARAAYDLPVGAFTIEPRLALGYTHAGQNGFSETGAGMLDLQYSATRADVSDGTATLRMMRSLNAGSWTLLPWVEAGVQETFSGLSRSVTATDGAFSAGVSGVSPAPTAGIVSAGITVAVTEAFDLFATYRGQFAANQIGNALSAGALLRF
jgi:autotransporter-associated beta strand protein